VEVAVAGGGTEVLETDVQRTDIFENGVLDPHADERSALAIDHGVTGEPRPAERSDTLPQPRGERRFPDDADDAAEPASPADVTSVDVAAPRVEAVLTEKPAEKARDAQSWTSKLSMLLVAVVALAGLAVLGVAIARELSAGNSSEDLADLGYTYTCDKLSGSDPGVYGVGHCHASQGLQASGMIPVGQAYVLTPRKANALGYTQSFACSGGRADSPSMVVPKRCAAVGSPVLASK
jgi:hypothetical protein